MEPVAIIVYAVVTSCGVVYGAWREAHGDPLKDDDWPYIFAWPIFGILLLGLGALLAVTFLPYKGLVWLFRPKKKVTPPARSYRDNEEASDEP
jgi:hypothetical protein